MYIVYTCTCMSSYFLIWTLHVHVYTCNVRVLALTPSTRRLTRPAAKTWPCWFASCCSSRRWVWFSSNLSTVFQWLCVYIQREREFSVFCGGPVSCVESRWFVVIDGVPMFYFVGVPVSSIYHVYTCTCCLCVFVCICVCICVGVGVGVGVWVCMV